MMSFIIPLIAALAPMARDLIENIGNSFNQDDDTSSASLIFDEAGE